VNSVEWAHERYNSWLETVIDVMKPRDRAEATRVLDFCVRDIASGRRRARAGRPHARPAEPLDLLAYPRPESSPAVQGTPAPAPRSSKAAAKPSPTIGRPPDNAKRAAKLRDLADKLEARANAELSADRLENTRRRADMAANI